MDMLETIRALRHENSDPDFILDHVEAWLVEQQADLAAEQADRDAATEAEMDRGTDRLTKLAASFGCPAVAPFGA